MNTMCNLSNAMFFFLFVDSMRLCNGLIEKKSFPGLLYEKVINLLIIIKLHELKVINFFFLHISLKPLSKSV